MRKKMELLQKYASDSLQDEEEKSKKMLGLWRWIIMSLICKNSDWIFWSNWLQNNFNKGTSIVLVVWECILNEISQKLNQILILVI